MSLDPNNVDRLCRHLCPCCRRTCTCVADSYILTTSVCVANLAAKVVYFVVLMGIWRINLCYAALWLAIRLLPFDDTVSKCLRHALRPLATAPAFLGDGVVGIQRLHYFCLAGIW